MLAYVFIRSIVFSQCYMFYVAYITTTIVLSFQKNFNQNVLLEVASSGMWNLVVIYIHTYVRIFRRTQQSLSCDLKMGATIELWTLVLKIVNDDQKDANILAYLFIPNQLYIFRAMSSPVIRSTWLYLQHLILSTGIAAGWCHGWDGTQFHLTHDTSRQQYRWTISDAVNTVKCSWWRAKTSPEICRAD